MLHRSPVALAVSVTLLAAGVAVWRATATKPAVTPAAVADHAAHGAPTSNSPALAPHINPGHPPGPAPDGVNEAGDWYPKRLLVSEPLKPFQPQ